MYVKLHKCAQLGGKIVAILELNIEILGLFRDLKAKQGDVSYFLYIVQEKVSVTTTSVRVTVLTTRALLEMLRKSCSSAALMS